MVVKILSSSASFAGVRYNTDKMQNERGELMKVANFGALQGINNLRPEDYKNYLKSISVQNSKVKNPQFHVAISCKGKEYSKFQLTSIADKWLEEMGYKDQPYMVVYHSDTPNNHVHIVSTRIDKEGKKINDSFEKKKAIQVLDKVMGLDVKISFEKELEKMLNYNFSTISQFKLLFEQKGYLMSEIGGQLIFRKGNDIVGSVEITDVNTKIQQFIKDKKRASQLRAVFHKYKNIAKPDIYTDSLKISGDRVVSNKYYSSDLAKALKVKFGIDIVFHSKDNKLPYGYTIIDNKSKSVYKGSEVMPLKEFITPLESGEVDKYIYHLLLKEDKQHEVKRFAAFDRYEQSVLANMFNVWPEEVVIIKDPKKEGQYADTLRAIKEEYSLLKEGLKVHGFEIYSYSGNDFLIDRENGYIGGFERLQGLSNELDIVTGSIALTEDSKEEKLDSFSSSSGLNLSDDDDDGLKRKKRKKK